MESEEENNKIYDMDFALKSNNVNKIKIVGLLSEMCVLHTCADARFRDYPVIVYADSTMGLTAKAHNNALEHMKNILGVIIE